MVAETLYTLHVVKSSECIAIIVSYSNGVYYMVIQSPMSRGFLYSCPSFSLVIVISSLE